MRRVSLIFLFVIIAIIGCSKGPSGISEDGFDINFPKPQQYITKVALSESQIGYLESENKFSLNLMNELFDGKDLLVSPLGVQMMLGMALTGADGATAKEIVSALGYGEQGSQAVKEYHKVLLEQMPALDDGVELMLADAAIVNDNNHLKNSFRESLQYYYYAPAETVSFVSHEALTRINEWSRRNTNGLIYPLMESFPDTDVEAMLLSALYFKAKWQTIHNHPLFHKSQEKGVFYTAENETINHYYLYTDEAFLPYYADKNYQMIGFPYSKGKYVLFIVLPRESGINPCKTIIQTMASGGLKDFIGKVSSSYVCAYIPEFAITNTLQLKDAFKDLGIASAFEVGADFSNMIENQGDIKTSFFLGGAMQKTVLKVEEWGTEAAASSEAYFPAPIDPGDGYDPIIFNANHPFVFFIAEKETGVVLFEGVYTGVQ